MKFGLTLFPTEYTIRPGELAAAAEASGFESLWFPEHSHFPVSPFTPGPDSGVGPPKMYYHLLEPFAAIAAAAATSEHLLLGTSICLVVQRDPIHLAKQVATADVLSGGRLQLGVGAGWHPLEIANHGTDFGQRLAVMRERLEAMKAIWTQEQAEYHGKHVDFAPLYQWPKPVQKPWPPIHVGANGPNGLARVVRDGDAWFPVLNSADDEEKVLPLVPALRERVERAGRDPDAFEISLYMCPPDEALLARCREAGVQRAIFLLEPEAREGALAQVERLAELARRCA